VDKLIYQDNFPTAGFSIVDFLKIQLFINPLCMTIYYHSKAFVKKPLGSVKYFFNQTIMSARDSRQQIINS
jgi:hypothetical protein